MSLNPNFYHDRLCLNVLAGSPANAQAIWQAAEGHVLVGVLSKNYASVLRLSLQCVNTRRSSTMPFPSA